ncbi:unnamed protein product, partial [Aphanomyces euteiches]
IAIVDCGRCHEYCICDSRCCRFICVSRSAPTLRQLGTIGAALPVGFDSFARRFMANLMHQVF